MSFRTRIIPLVFVLAALLPRPATADMADGGYNISFDTDLPIWDISGTYFQQVDDLTLEYTIVMEPNGKFTGEGTGEFTGLVGDEFVDLTDDFSFRGKVTRSGGVARVTLSFSLRASEEFFDERSTFSASVSQRLEIDPNLLAMAGTISASIRASITGQPSLSVRVSEDVALDLPGDMDGTWQLWLNVFQLDNGGAATVQSSDEPILFMALLGYRPPYPFVFGGRKDYYGTAQIDLSNGSSIYFDLSGTYSARSDTSTFTLKGLDIFRNSSLRLTATVVDGEMTLQSLQGTVFGQSLKFVNGQ